MGKSGRRFLGLDSSTQSLTALVIDYDRRQVLSQTGVHFDTALPHYGTENGVLHDSDPKVVHAPPLMWAEALDRVLEKMVGEGVEPGSILAISGSAQQHGSVYLNRQAPAALAALDPRESLADGLRGIFSRPTSPVWMDSSTSAECQQIRQRLGGMEATARATGSDAFERFTGPQIRRFAQEQPGAYAATHGVALVSSYLASVLTGTLAPLDHGDAAGMNLMDIRTREWHPQALAATAPDLVTRLPPLVASDTVVGNLSPYFSAKYGFAPDTQVVAFTGDNPSSLVGVGLVEAGLMAISLGTSDTCFGALGGLRTDDTGQGHVFASPTGGYMALICFHNGSLARQRVRDAYGLDWRGFSRALESTPPGNSGRVLLPYFEPEIVPRVPRAGVHRFGGLTEDDAAANCRAVVEAQMMSMRLHSRWMGEPPSRIYATGGGSANRAILQVMADVHNCPVHRFGVTASAALGAALRAAHAYLNSRGETVEWPQVVAGLAEPVEGSEIQPQAEAARLYDRFVEQYAAMELRGIGEEGG